MVMGWAATKLRLKILSECYAEKLLVAYIDADVADDFVRIARILQQECYAYERDGELFIAK